MISTEKFVQKQEAKSQAEIKISILELDVLRLVAEGKNGHEIAKIVYKSPRTVENIRNVLRDKLGVQTLAGLVAKAFALRLIDVPAMWQNESQYIIWQIRA